MSEKIKVLFVCMGNICRSPTAHGVFRKLVHLQARRVSAQDCERFDYVVAMDEENLMKLEELCPEGHEHKLCLLLDFLPDSPLREVPDPYYGGMKGFERVLDLVEEASKGLLMHIVEKHF